MLVSLLCAFPEGIAAEQLPLKSYTTVDGLPSDRVNCILRDSHGFLWFGTWDGISRFDGYGFENLTAADGFPGPSVNALLESHDGTYWAATVGGLAHWDPTRRESPSRTRFEVVKLGDRPLIEAAFALLEDRLGSLWVGTASGLYRWNPSSNPKALRISLEESAKPPEVYALLEDPDGGLWIGADRGLFFRAVDGRTTRLGGRDGFPTEVRCLLRDRTGRIWIGTHESGIFRVDSASPAGGAVRHLSTTSNGLAGDHVLGLLESADGTVWAACYGGLSRFAPGPGPDRDRPRTYTRAQGLVALGIFSLAEDAAGNIWIGTDDAGVMRLVPRGFRTYNGEDALQSTRVVSVLADRGGRACVYTAGKTSTDARTDTNRLLQCFDGTRFHAVTPRLPAGTHFGWGWSQVTFQDSRGGWWIPTFEGLYRFPAAEFTTLATAVPRRYTTTDGLPSNEIFRVFEDSRGDVWMSLSDSTRCLARWKRASDSIVVYGPSDGLPAGDSPISFAEDGSGALWIGFYNGGLARHRDDRFTFFGEADGIPAGRTRCLYRDRAGNLWVGASRGGIARIEHPEAVRPRFTRFTTAENLSSNDAWSLADDRWGRIYIGTERGLDRLDPATGIVQTFTADDGLVRGVIETTIEDGAGTLWFGSGQGVSSLAPEPEGRRDPPPARISRVLLDGTRQALPDIGAVHVRLPDLTASTGPLQLEYFGIDFAAGGRLRYQYQLEGADAEWGPPRDERSVIYAHLRPGGYRFRVRAVANDGSFSPEPANVEFRILPPYWQRPWFVAACAAALILLAYLLHRYRLRQVLAVERLRTRIATDLHDDIGSSLSQIAILSEIARQQPGGATEKVQDMLARIGAVSRDLVDSLGDTVWAIDPRRDRLEDLVHRMRRFAGDLLTEKQIEVVFDARLDDPERDLPADMRRQLFLVFKEAVHNMARHSGCTRAEIDFRVDDGSLALCLKDNGCGFDPAGREGGYGVASIRERIARLHGSIELVSCRADQPGAPGTTVFIAVPLPK